MPDIIYVKNDNRLKANGLHTFDDVGAKVFIDSSAMVTVTLYDDLGTPIVGETWPLTMACILVFIPPDVVGISLGNFQVVLRNELVLTVGRDVRAKLIIDAGDNQHAELTGQLVVQQRRF